MSRRILTVNRNTQSLVNVTGQSAAALATFETNKVDFQISVTDDSTSGFNQKAAVLDLSTFGFRAVLAITVTGTAGDEAENTLAATYEGGWSWDVTSQSVFGTVDFNTTQIADFIGDNDVSSALLEFNLVRPSDGRYETILQIPVTLKANADVGQATAPSILTAPPAKFRRAIATAATVALSANVVTFNTLGLAFTPSDYFCFVSAPAGSGPIWANFVLGSATTSAASFILSAIPENTNYFLTIVPVV